MCGIVAVLRRPSRRGPPPSGELLARLDATLGVTADVKALVAAAQAVRGVDSSLRGVPGVRALMGDARLPAEIETRLDRLDGAVVRIETALDAGDPVPAGGPAAVEAVNAALIELKDGLWAIRNDRLRTARLVADLAGAGAGQAAIEACTSLQMALSSIDRLEVRGRDSAGLHILVEGHGLDIESATVLELLGHRTGNRLFTSLAVRTPGDQLAFVYKAAAEIGELGDNTRRLRELVRADPLLRLSLQAPSSRATVLAHTRWASMGIISEANAHPLNQEEDGRDPGPYVASVLNGDVDNYAVLKAQERLRIPVEVTTDAKVIPVLVSRRLGQGMSVDEAFLITARALEGSVAVATACGEDPRRLLLALRGSGQALYVGLAEDAYIVASEPYGLVEETSTYLRMDGETGDSPGQIVVLDADRAGSVEGIDRSGYDGPALPVAAGDLRKAEITTRDVDRAGFPHYLLKEISQAPLSVQKTLRGRLVTGDAGHLKVVLGDESLPPTLRRRLRDGTIRRIVVVGQGTAAVAGQSLAVVLAPMLAGSGVTVEATLATELSGFGMVDDMADVLVVAVSQSGTTTDTNRTVGLVRARGAAVIGIVNRRNSDLVEKVDGVLYTSDGRDVEMAVPSTKAFYAQVAACALLAVALAEQVARGPGRWSNGPADRARSESRAIQSQAILGGLRDLPQAMAEVLDCRTHIAQVAQRHAPSRRYWALVGNGNNLIAAQELRIKLSELCYKSIACDLTEDKKHVDLSSEPLILVCAAGLPPANADDVAKEVAIYRAHNAAPIVICDDRMTGCDAAMEVLRVPILEPATLSFVLSAMAGHLFGYEAALAIDAQARPLREIRSALDSVLSHGDPLVALSDLSQAISQPAASFVAELQAGEYNGHLEASTAMRVATLLRHATVTDGLAAYEAETGRVATPTAFVGDLAGALTRAIGELTRPVDAIKHQAKTVTVGTSRSEEALYANRLVGAVLGAGVGRERLGYRVLRTLIALDPAVTEVTGHTRYSVQGRLDADATVRVINRAGVAADIQTRTDQDPRLRGSKHRAASLREVLVARGGADDRTVVIVPEMKEGEVVGIVLLHAQFAHLLPASAARTVLAAYLDRYAALSDAVTERQPTFDEAMLAEVPIVELLTEAVRVLADRWQPGCASV